VRHEVCGRRDDLGETALVIGAKERGTRGRDDVVTDLVGERWTIGRTPLPLISGDVSTCAIKPITGTSGLADVAAMVANT
jgi:hypothetical protein